MENSCIWILVNEDGRTFAFETFVDAHTYVGDHGLQCVGKHMSADGRFSYDYWKVPDPGNGVGEVGVSADATITPVRIIKINKNRRKTNGEIRIYSRPDDRAARL